MQYIRPHAMDYGESIGVHAVHGSFYHQANIASFAAII